MKNLIILLVFLLLIFPLSAVEVASSGGASFRIPLEYSPVYDKWFGDIKLDKYLSLDKHITLTCIADGAVCDTAIPMSVLKSDWLALNNDATTNKFFVTKLDYLATKANGCHIVYD